MYNSKPTAVRIGSDIFYIEKFNPFRALKVLGDVQKVIVPAIKGAGQGYLVSAADHMEADSMSLAVLIPAIIGAMDYVSANLSGDDLEKLGRLLLDPDYVSVSHNKQQAVTLDEDKIIEVFAGRPIDMIFLMVKVFEANYGDFMQSSIVPAGARNVWEDVKRAFRERTPMISEPAPSSTAPSKKG